MPSTRTPSHQHWTTARSVVIGSILRSARTEAGLRCVDVAQRLGWSLSKVSRLETGTRGATDTNLIQFAAVCGMLDHRLDRVRSLAEANLARSGHWVEGRDAARDAVQVLESDAETITAYGVTTVPALAQTPAYSRALAAVHGTGEAEVRATSARQAGFARRQEDNSALFLVHETALRADVGDPGVMAGQLDHLARVGLRDNRRVLVVPASRSGHLDSFGPFTLLSGRAPVTSVVLLHHLTNTVFLDNERDWRSYRDAVSSLISRALPEDESRAWIGHSADRLKNKISGPGGRDKP